MLFTVMTRGVQSASVNHKSIRDHQVKIDGALDSFVLYGLIAVSGAKATQTAAQFVSRQVRNSPLKPVAGVDEEVDYGDHANGDKVSYYR